MQEIRVQLSGTGIGPGSEGWPWQRKAGLPINPRLLPLGIWLIGEVLRSNSTDLFDLLFFMLLPIDTAL